MKWFCCSGTFVSHRQKHPEKDAGLQKFIEGGENCRRKCLLECLGDPSTLSSPGFEHCDCCSRSALTLPLYTKLAVLGQGVATRKKCKAEVRSVHKSVLREKLIQARKDFLDQRDDFYDWYLSALIVLFISGNID